MSVSVWQTLPFPLSPLPFTQWGRPSPVVSIKVSCSRVLFRVLQVNSQTIRL